jgi:hypothetical protein
MGWMEDIERLFCVQTAVYWDAPINDGYGGFTWAVPVELDVRWDAVSEKIITQRGGGEEIISQAKVEVLQDVEINGMMYLGTLASLSVAEKANPMLLEDAYLIQRFDKIPAPLITNDFFRLAYL